MFERSVGKHSREKYAGAEVMGEHKFFTMEHKQYIRKSSGSACIRRARVKN